VKKVLAGFLQAIMIVENAGFVIPLILSES
jgi:hypothetical protein